MAYLGNALQQLRDERRRAQLQIEKMDSAISALEGLIGRNSTTPLRRRMRRGRTVSAAARRRMTAAQRARRAREQGQARRTAGKKVSATPKPRKLSAAGRKRTAAAAKARWARFRAKAKKAH
jgi:hypothetical protein